MMAQVQQIKRDEQYPLLKVDSELGDANLPPQPPTIISPGWKIACAPKISWLKRWPELITACWMTLILLGITLLVFYVMSMSAYRRQPLFIVKCNSSKVENNVYFHHIIPRGSYLSFRLYSDYLSNMAMEYPFLDINIFFLIDDSLYPHAYEGAKSSMIFKRFGIPNLNDYTPMNAKDKEAMKTFKQRYENVNITIMPLSRYMSLTPLRYKWKMIPIYYLPFYARIISVWEYGGISMDLTTFNNLYNSNQLLDRKITAILKQHNDGIEERKYVQTINAINREEESEFFSLFYSLMTRIFNNTFSFFDTSLSHIPMTTETNQHVFTLSRHYRNKRESAETIVTNFTGQILTRSPVNKETSAHDDVNYTKVLNTMETDLLSSIAVSRISNNTKEVNNTESTISKNKENSTSSALNKPRRMFYNINRNTKLNDTKLGTEFPNFILFYDFSIFSDEVGPSYVVSNNPQPLQETIKTNIREPMKNINKPPYLLSISTDGSFIAATSQHHPFLGHLLTSGCKRVNPKYAIENTMLSQCSGLLRDDVYCNNIFIL